MPESIKSRAVSPTFTVDLSTIATKGKGNFFPLTIKSLLVLNLPPKASTVEYLIRQAPAFKVGMSIEARPLSPCETLPSANLVPSFQSDNHRPVSYLASHLGGSESPGLTGASGSASGRAAMGRSAGNVTLSGSSNS
ncbi:MAG: hypothetical protein BWX66_01036 [Deltaproteobacteria bacterium ADurb.Bin058]|nr:MAG: hypothetical protein BWX66_01036 [Deltaproteobacteria bacterium ADurb.Bin058]